jgi:hypothetical protein
MPARDLNWRAVWGVLALLCGLVLVCGVGMLVILAVVGTWQGHGVR